MRAGPFMASHPLVDRGQNVAIGLTGLPDVPAKRTGATVRWKSHWPRPAAVVAHTSRSALHTFEQYANNPVEADHGPLKARLRPMRGLKRHHSARILAAGHAFVQKLRRGHYDIATEVRSHHRLRVAFDDLAFTI